jgi:hypothetical protein
LWCCCHFVVVVFVYFVAALPTPPLPPLPSVGVEVDWDGAQDDHDGVGHYLIVWAIELSGGKNQEKRYTMALGGHQTQIKMQQPTKNMRAWWGRDETWGATGRECGGARFDCFRAIELGYSVNNYWTTINAFTNLFISGSIYKIK